ncbi:MAG: hypothetical protein WHT64_07940 [Desulfomicrobiaceae bacterium]
MRMETLLYFLRYFEPHCEEREGVRRCYLSALDYPQAEDAAQALEEHGMAVTSLERRFVRLEVVDGDRRWVPCAATASDALPIWEARWSPTR